MAKQKLRGSLVSQLDEALKTGKNTEREVVTQAEKFGPDSEVYQFAKLRGLIQDKPQATTQPTPQLQQPSMADMIRRLQEQQEAATIKGLEKARERSLGALAQEEQQIAPQFQQARTGVRTQAQKGRRGFDEFLASRGIGGSGAGAQSELASRVAEQGDIGQLRQQETQAFGDIARRRSDIQTGFEADVASARAGAESQALQNIINQQNLDRQRELQVAGLTGELGGQRTLSGQQFDVNTQLQQQQLAQQQQQLAIAQQNADLQRQQIEQSLRAGEISNEQAQFALQQAQDPNSVQNRANQIQLQLAEANLQFLPQQQQLQLEQLRRQINQIGRTPTVTPAQQQEQALRLQLLQEQVNQARLQTGFLEQPAPLPTTEGEIFQAFREAQGLGVGQQFLQDNEAEIINTLGFEGYQQLFNSTRPQLVRDIFGTGGQ